MAYDSKDPPNLQMSVETFTAEKVHLYVRQLVSEYDAIASSAKLSSYLETITRQMALTLTCWMAGGKVPSEPRTKIVRWPDGTWQMFKEVHLPEWFKRRFPVRWHTEEF